MRSATIWGTSSCGAALVCILAASDGLAAAFSFTPLGDLLGGSFHSAAYGVSADGSVIVGSGRWEYGEEAFRWTAAGGMVGLGFLPNGIYSTAYGVSADGSTIVGEAGGQPTGEGRGDPRPFRWTSSSGMVNLGDLPGGTPNGAAYGVSANGSVVVGYSSSFTSSLREQAFRWTSGGMVGMQDLPNDIDYSHARAVSADGSVAVGFGGDFNPVRWNSGGSIVSLGFLAGGGSGPGAAYGVSADGSVAVGASNSSMGYQAFRWTADGGMVALGDLPGGSFSSSATGVSADGSVIVGQGTSASGDEAFRWTSSGGMVSLRELLVTNDVGGLTGWTLQWATAVSADGRTIVGYGSNPSGQFEAWVATVPLAIVPEPPTWILAGIGFSVLFLCARRRFRNRLVGER